MARAALIITDSNKEMVLVGHNPLRKGEAHSYDLPKGHLEEGETPLEAIIREAYEEINYTPDPENLEELGTVKYTSSENITYFMEVLPENMDIQKFIKDRKCNATFERYGRKFPEMDTIKWVPFGKIFDFLYLNHEGPLSEVLDV